MPLPPLALCLLAGSGLQEPAAASQRQEPQPPPAEVAEVIVTAQRHEGTVFDTPRAVNVVDEEELRRLNPAVAVDGLHREIGLWIEHRTATTGDVVMRGLAGSTLLALVDGNTLSTFWGEGGLGADDLYGKVDPYSLERIEVVRGPASVLYGSNALGGVINFISRKPPLPYTSEGTEWGGELRGAYGTNNDLRRGRVDFWGANRWMRWRAGGTAARYDDYRGGSDVGELTPTGGKEANLDWNSEFLLSPDEVLRLEVQGVHRDPIHRFYRPQQRNSNDRLGTNLELRSERETLLWDEASVRLYRQDKEDWRFWVSGPTAGQRGVARWLTYQVNPQAHVDLGSHELTYGLAFQLDRGESPDDEQFTIYPAGGGPPRKAAPDSDWWNYGAYVQDEWHLHEDWSVLGAARYDYFLFRTILDRFYQPAVGNRRADDIRAEESAVTGGLSLMRHLGEAFNAYASWFRGFRQFAPVFGFTQHGQGIRVPGELLPPVTADTYELGLKLQEEGLEGSLALYYTDFSNFQNMVPGTWNGQKFFDWNNNGIFEPDERVYVTTGNGEAWVRGVELWQETRLDRVWDRPAAADWSLGAGFMWNIGADETNNEPLRFTAPMRGLFALTWEPRSSGGDLWVSVEGDVVDRYDRVGRGRLLSDVGYRQDPQDPTSPLIRPYGLPGYSVFNVRGGYTFHNGVEVVAAVENLLDKNYRAAHSRVDAMGLTFVVGVTVPF